MDIALDFISKIWVLFWSIWPKNFLFLILASAVSEALSVTVFRISTNRGGLAVLGYILGFFVVAFYAEAQKYSTLSVSYPIYMVAMALFTSMSAFLVFHDKFSVNWFLGFLFTLLGIYLIQSSIGESIK